jgi:trehalose 6-phosphate synthase
MDKVTNRIIDTTDRKKQENSQGNAEGFGSPDEIGPRLQQLRKQHGYTESKIDKSIDDSKGYKLEEEQDSGGIFIRLNNFIRLQKKVDEIRKAKGCIFIVSNRGPMGYNRVSNEAFKEVYGAGGVAVALRSVKSCTKDLVRFLSMPLERDDRNAQAAMEKLGYIPLEKQENNRSSNKTNREILLRRSSSMNDIEQKGTEIAKNGFLPDNIEQSVSSQYLGETLPTSFYQSTPAQALPIDQPRIFEMIQQSEQSNIKSVDNNFVADNDITDEDINKYYNKFSNTFLWFTFHGMGEYISESAEDIKNHWESYRKVNQAFANKLSKMIEKDQEQGKKPIVMLNDYHLFCVSAMLRAKHPNIVLQHFIHIPWPEPQIFLDEPRKIVNGIYKGLSGNDIIGFQTEKDATNFLKGVQWFLPYAEVNFNESTVRWKDGHNTRVRVYPISIDVDKTRQMAKAANRESAKAADRESVKEMKKIMSAGRMDLIKNDVGVLESYGLMLDKHPKIHGKVIFTPRLVPSRQSVEAYKNLQKDIIRTIAEVNKRYSTESWTPIIPDYENNHKDALGKMMDADVVVVGSLADGMNMVALEAATVMKQGVLVLSAKAGAHGLLKEGVLSVNDPRNTQEMADHLYEALMMSPEERRSKTARARKIVEKNDLLQWQYKQFSDICDVLKTK